MKIKIAACLNDSKSTSWACTERKDLHSIIIWPHFATEKPHSATRNDNLVINILRQWNLTYPILKYLAARIIWPWCTWSNAVWKDAKMLKFWSSEVWQLFILTMDNMNLDDWHGLLCQPKPWSHQIPQGGGIGQLPISQRKVASASIMQQQVATSYNLECQLEEWSSFVKE